MESSRSYPSIFLCLHDLLVLLNFDCTRIPYQDRLNNRVVRQGRVILSIVCLASFPLQF